MLASDAIAWLHICSNDLCWKWSYVDKCFEPSDILDMASADRVLELIEEPSLLKELNIRRGKFVLTVFEVIDDHIKPVISLHQNHFAQLFDKSNEDVFKFFAQYSENSVNKLLKKQVKWEIS